MSKLNLATKVTKTPDFDGFAFFVQAGEVFDADAYAEAYNLNVSEIDAQDIKSAQNAAAQLNIGEWLEVSHPE